MPVYLYFCVCVPISVPVSVPVCVCVSSYHILGEAGVGLGHEFYSLPSLASSLCATLLAQLHALPDHRLRPVIRILGSSESSRVVRVVG